MFLSKINQPEKVTCCVAPITWHSGEDRVIEIVKRSVVAGAFGEGYRRSTGVF